MKQRNLILATHSYPHQCFVVAAYLQHYKNVKTTYLFVVALVRKKSAEADDNYSLLCSMSNCTSETDMKTFWVRATFWQPERTRIKSLLST